MSVRQVLSAEHDRIVNIRLAASSGGALERAYQALAEAVNCLPYRLGAEVDYSISNAAKAIDRCLRRVERLQAQLEAEQTGLPAPPERDLRPPLVERDDWWEEDEGDEDGDEPW